MFHVEFVHYMLKKRQLASHKAVDVSASFFKKQQNLSRNQKFMLELKFFGNFYYLLLTALFFSVFINENVKNIDACEYFPHNVNEKNRKPGFIDNF
jgi:hypothetical protein